MTDPGFYPGIPRDEYDAIEAMRYSTLKFFRQSPLHARMQMTSPSDPSPAMLVGQAVNTAIFYPDQVDSQFVQALAVPKRSKVQKEQHLAFAAANRTKHILKPDEMDRVKRMQKAVWSNADARALLTGKGANELGVVWEDEIGPTRCKSLLDRMTTDANDYPCIVDLKTSRALDRHLFSRFILDYGYHIQAAMYLRGANKIRPLRRKYYFICVENAAPFDCRVLQLEEDAIEQGEREVERYLRLNHECVTNDTWPGYGNGWVSLPSYGFDKDDLDG
jgi:hypothetical protein